MTDIESHLASSDGLSRTRHSLRRDRVAFPKASHVVAQQIREYILSSGATDGSAILPVKDIVEQLGVATSTVREALRVLEAEGLVTIKPGPKGGVFVRRPTHDNITKQLAMLLEFEHTDLSSMLEARRLLEPMCTRLAAARADEGDIETLTALTDRLEECIGLQDPYVWIRENAEFHVAIAAAARNDVLRILMTSLRELIYVSTIGVSRMENSRRRTIQAHRDIIAAMRNHDSQQAEQLMLDHLLCFEKSLAEGQATAEGDPGTVIVLSIR